MRDRRKHFSSALLVSAALLLLTSAPGCGGGTPSDAPDMAEAPVAAGFVGTWKGVVTVSSSTCSNGQTYPASSQINTYVLSLIAGGDVSLPLDCGTVEFVPQQLAAFADQRAPVTCAPVVSGGATVTSTLDGGQLELLTATQLKVSFDENSVVTGSGASYSCPSTLTGTLTKQ